MFFWEKFAESLKDELFERLFDGVSFFALKFKMKRRQNEFRKGEFMVDFQVCYVIIMVIHLTINQYLYLILKCYSL